MEARYIQKNAKCVAVAKYMKRKTTINVVESIIFSRQHINVVQAQLYEIYISRVLVRVSMEETNRLFCPLSLHSLTTEQKALKI